MMRISAVVSVVVLPVVVLPLVACSAPDLDRAAVVVVDLVAVPGGVAARAGVAEAVEGVAAAEGGLGARLTLATMGSGPADVRSAGVDLQCLDSERRCSDPLVVAGRVEDAMGVYSALVADAPSAGGSDPVGGLYALLKSLSSAGVPTKMHVFSDFYSRSETFDVETVDISTAEARSVLVDHLAGRGLDFASLGLAEWDITVHLLAAGTGGLSSAYFEQVRSLVGEILSRTGATVTVTTA